MSKEYQNILENALELPQNEFFALVQALLKKLQDQISTEPQDGISVELLEALEQRVKDIDTGNVKPISGDKVMSKIKKRFA